MRTILVVLMSVAVGAAGGSAAFTFWLRQRTPPTVAAPVPSMTTLPPPAGAPARASGPTRAQWAALDERLGAIETNIVKIDERASRTAKELDEMSMRLEVRTGQLRPFREPAQREPLVPMRSTSSKLLPSSGKTSSPASPGKTGSPDEALPDW